MPLRLLKTKTTIPLALEDRLCNHWGFAIEKRNYLANPAAYILFKKVTNASKSNDDSGVFRTIRASVHDNPEKSNVVELHAKPEGLTKWQRGQLEKRCDNIVGFFPDPYSVPQAVRTRLAIMQQKMLPAEVAFVQEYMDENFPV